MRIFKELKRKIELCVWEGGVGIRKTFSLGGGFGQESQVEKKWLNRRGGVAMADWKENKVVGIVAGVIFILCLLIVIKGIIKVRPPKAPSLQEQIEQAGGKI